MAEAKAVWCYLIVEAQPLTIEVHASAYKAAWACARHGHPEDIRLVMTRLQNGERIDLLTADGLPSGVYAERTRYR